MPLCLCGSITSHAQESQNPRRRIRTPSRRKKNSGLAEFPGRRWTTINKTIIRCNCGHRIFRKDVLQTGLYLSASGPSYVYVRFRCGRCKRVGEQLVQENNWDPGVLQHTEVHVSEDELRRFSDLGEITAEEVIAFHYGLDALTADTDDRSELT